MSTQLRVGNKIVIIASGLFRVLMTNKNKRIAFIYNGFHIYPMNKKEERTICSHKHNSVTININSQTRMRTQNSTNSV